MLKIIINGNEADLGDLTSISLKYNGGVFDFNNVTGSYSIPFKLPLNNINRVLFNFPWRVGASSSEIREYDTEIWHSGIKMIEGVITAKVINKKSIQCDLKTDNGNLYNKLRSKKLNEHDYGGAKPFVFKEEYSVDDDDFLLYAVENYNFFDDTAFEDYWHTGDTGSSLLNCNQNQYDYPTQTGTFVFDANWPTVITPFPLLWRVLNYLFSNLGFSYTDGFFDTGDYKTLNIFSINNAVLSETYIDGADTKTRNVIDTVDLANHLPEMETTDFIKAIQNFFNISFQASNNQIRIIDRLAMIQSQYYKDITTKIVSDHKKTLTGFVLGGLSFNVVRDESDMNINELDDLSQHPSPEHVVNIEDYEPRPNEIVYADNIYKRFANNKDVVGGEAIDVWMWYNFPYIAVYTDEARNYLKQSPWAIAAKSFTIDNLPTPLPNNIYGRTDQGYQYRIPKIKQKGNSYVHKSINNFSFRLMFYSGKQSTQNNALAGVTESIVQPVGTDFLNDKEISARWSYQDRWAEFLSWYENAAKAEYEQDIQLSASEIKNFSFSEIKMINNVKFFIKSFSVKLNRTTISSSKCKLIRAN